MKQRLTAFLTGIRQDLPRLGSAGSRSAQLHADGISEDAAGSLPGALYDFCQMKTPLARVPPSPSCVPSLCCDG